MIGADLRYANLSGADLTQANLSRVDFTGAKLVNAHLDASSLTGAIFNRVDLSQLRLSNAKGQHHIDDKSAPIASLEVGSVNLVGFSTGHTLVSVLVQTLTDTFCFSHL